MIWTLIYTELVVYGKPLSFNGLYFDWVPQTVHDRIHISVILWHSKCENG